ncbi:autotransporter-associated beta strand repeat-containing protein [Candidatus Pelagibacter sp. HIMB1483]|uniref:autotransporter-associated beta strand repeat-containing protein n=1 Tax=Candidatus Pelagibacter sp. HIMB1483 TaxID=3415414 RepID=UPI003F867A3D
MQKKLFNLIKIVSIVYVFLNFNSINTFADVVPASTDTTVNTAVDLQGSIKQNRTYSITNDAVYRIEAPILSTSYSITKTGNGTLVFNDTNITNFSADIIITEGTVAASNNNTLGSGTVRLNGGTLSSDSTGARTLSNAISIQASSELGDATNSGALTLSGNIDFSAGDLILSSRSNNEISGTVNLYNDNQTFSIDSSVTQTMSGNVRNGTLIKSGSGILVLSGTNTYTGDTNINAGTLNVSGQLNSGSYSGEIDNSGTFTFSSNSDQTISGNITGSGTLTKSGSSTLTLSGTNTYSGITTISDGTVRLNGGTLSDNTAVTVESGAIFDINNSDTIGSIAGAGTIDITSKEVLTVGADNSSTTFSGIIQSDDGTGTGAITKAGTGSLTLSGNNNFGGAVNVNAGSLMISSNNALGNTNNFTTVASGATIDFQNVNYSTTESLRNSGTISTSTGTSTFAGSITLFANSTVDVDGTQLTLSGGITDSGTRSLEKTGNGILELSADNSYTGGTTITEGTLLVSGSGDLGTGTLTISSAGTLDLQNTLSVSSLVISGAGSGNRINNSDADGTTANLTVSGTSTLNGAINTDGTQTYSGTTTLGSDVNLTGPTIALAAVTASGTEDLTITGNLDLDGAVSGVTNMSVSGTSNIGADVTTTGTQSYTGTTTVSASSTLIGTEISAAAIALNDDLEIRNSSDSTLASVISGTGALTKSGSGALTLRGVNTFDGDLTVSAGTLYAGLAADSGNQIIENNVTVSGGTLSGGATIGGNVTVATANLAPGNSIGTLTIDGNVTLDDNSTTTIEFNDTTSDKVVVSGNITLAGALVLEPANTTYSDATFTIFDGSGGSGNSLSGTFASTTVSNSSYLGDATTSISYDTVNRKVFLNIDEDGGVSSNTIKSLTTRNNFKDIAQIFDDATAGKILEVANVLKSSDANSVNTELNKTKGTLLANSSLKSISNHQFYQKALDNIVSTNTNSSVSNFTQNNLADLTLDNLQSEGLYGEKASYNDYYDFSDQSVLGFIKNNKNRTLLSRFSSEDRSSFLRTYGTSSENENIGTDYTGYKSDTYGVLFGQQFKDSDKDFYGYAYGFSGTDIDYNNDYGETNAYTLHTSVFKQVSDDDYNLNLKLGGYLTNRQNERKVSVFGTSVNDIYKSETTDLGLQAGATYLRKYNILGLNLSPSMSLSTTYELKDDIDEKGGSLALKVDNENLLTIKPEVGFSLDKNFSTIENITNQFSFAIFASEDHYLEGTTASAKFATSSNFDLDLPKDKDQFLAAGLGYNFLNSESGTSLMANLFYTQNTENDYEGNLFSLTFRKLFGDFGRGRIPAVITEKVDEQKEKVVKIILPKVEKEEETIVDTVRRSLALLFQKQTTSYRAYKDIYENFDCKVLEDVRLYQSLMYLSRPQIVNLLEKCNIEDENAISLVANRLNDIRLNDLTMFEILKKNYYYSLIYLPFITFIAFVILMYELFKKGYFRLRRKP